jgi:hypothetical protein
MLNPLVNCILAFICTFVAIVPTFCYAVPTTTIEEITVDRVPLPFGKVGEETFHGMPGVSFSLTTIGMKVAGEKDIVIKWKDPASKVQREFALVTAQCLASEAKQLMTIRNYHSFSSYRDTTEKAITPEFYGAKKMYDFPSNELPPTIRCPEGYGLLVSFLLPNDSTNPKKYIYHGLLETTIDIDHRDSSSEYSDSTTNADNSDSNSEYSDSTTNADDSDSNSEYSDSTALSGSQKTNDFSIGTILSSATRRIDGAS